MYRKIYVYIYKYMNLTTILPFPLVLGSQDVEEDLALSRLEQVEIKKLKQKQLNEGWAEQIDARK